MKRLPDGASPHPHLPPEGEGAANPPPLGEGRVEAGGAKMFTAEPNMLQARWSR